jgi:putative AlgH/UPF0301 family transcriptional regulator
MSEIEKATMADFLTEFYGGQRHAWLVTECVQTTLMIMNPQSERQWIELARSIGIEVVS